MSAPATEELRELERELAIAADSGETRSRAELQNRFQWSATELQAALDTLREHGKAIEDAPGEWRGPLDDERPRAEPARVTVSVPDEEDAVNEAARVAAAARAQLMPASHFVAAQPQVRFTRAIADALDDQALGRIVKAALDSLDDDDETFRLEVTP